MKVRRARAANSCQLFKEDNFHTSKGKCSAAVREACDRSGINGRVFAADNTYNLEKKGLLEKAGFVNMIWKYNENTAPLGAILIYVGGVGHRYGHTEIRANPNLFCSDHCSKVPVTQVSAQTSKKYRLTGVYLPFVSSIQLSSLSTTASTVN